MARRPNSRIHPLLTARQTTFIFDLSLAELWRDFIMSMHRSLKGSTKIHARRNVMKRYERIDILRKNGRWKEGDKVIGLPKTKNE